MSRLVSRLRRDTRGMALIEFAFTVPILATLFVGGYQIMDAVSAYRKVTTTDRSLADLVTQTTSTTASGVQTFMAAAQQIMAPYPKANAVVRISQIKIDPTLTAADGKPKATIDWCQVSANATSCSATDPYYAAKDVSTLVPASMRVAGTYLIYADINYLYVPNIASGMLGNIPLRDTIFMSPRNSASVACATC